MELSTFPIECSAFPEGLLSDTREISIDFNGSFGVPNGTFMEPQFPVGLLVTLVRLPLSRGDLQ